MPGTAPADEVLARAPRALILSGGPASVKEKSAPKVCSELVHAGLPIFAICYGMQLIADEFGGTVSGWGRGVGHSQSSLEDNSQTSQAPLIREFGRAVVEVGQTIGPFSSFQVGEEVEVWMSHGDKVTKLPEQFTTIGSSSGSPIAAFGCESKKIFGVQFHPEVHHTARGKEILENFLFHTAHLSKDWDPSCFATEVIERTKSRVPTGNVVCGLSGGVDSTVAAVLVNQAIGERLHCIFVDNGLLRKNEPAEVMQSFTGLGLQVHMVDAREQFLSELKGVTDPEEKRKIIGRIFIEVFEEEAHTISDVSHLVQGTLYPDVIESISVVGDSVTIKSHHNVGGLTEDMKLDLIEPLRELFKDEVRAVGRGLGISEVLIQRQPFPGPGLAVRCLGEVTEERLEILRTADAIIREEVDALGLNDTIWQAFAVLLPVYSVGVMGDGRTYEQAVAIRAVTSRDGMTADWFYFEEKALRRISTRLINETAGINRVVLDVSTKPPSTIEWE